MAHKPFGNTKVCCINYCTNSSRNSSYNFQAFPVKKPLLAKWLQLIDRDKHIKPNWIPYFLKYGFICDIHFRNKELSSNLPTENLDLAPKPSGFMITEVFSISEAANGSGLLPVTIKQEPNLEIEDLLPNIKSEVVEIQREIVEDAGSSKSNPDSIAGFQGYVPAYSVIKTQSEGVTKHEFECSYCLEVFKSKIEITCHRQLKHEKNTYKCPAYNCHNEYRTEFHRDKHYEVEHYKSSIASPRAMYLCKHCPSVFFKQNHLEKHTEDEHAHIRGRKPRVDKMPTKTKKQRLLKKIAQKRINEKKIIQKPQKKVIIRKKISKKSAVEMEDLLSDMSDGSTTEEEIMEDESELGNVYQIKKENEESPYQCIVID